MATLAASQPIIAGSCCRKELRSSSRQATKMREPRKTRTTRKIRMNAIVMPAIFRVFCVFRGSKKDSSQPRLAALFQAATASANSAVKSHTISIVWLQTEIPAAQAFTYSHSCHCTSWMLAYLTWSDRNSLGYGQFVPFLRVNNDTDVFCFTRDQGIVLFQPDEINPIPLTFSECVLRELEQRQERMFRLSSEA